MDQKLLARLPARPALRLAGARDVHKMLWPRLLGLDREHLWRVDLDSRGGLLGAELVAIGTVDAAPAHPREIFSGALEARASRIVLVHNHPSGDVRPSAGDVDFTTRAAAAGVILGVELQDHVIIFEDRRFSFNEAGLLSGRKVWRKRKPMKR